MLKKDKPPMIKTMEHIKKIKVKVMDNKKLGTHRRIMTLVTQLKVRNNKQMVLLQQYLQTQIKQQIKKTRMNQLVMKVKIHHLKLLIMQMQQTKKRRKILQEILIKNKMNLKTQINHQQQLIQLNSLLLMRFHNFKLILTRDLRMKALIT
jgi:hypothetical protein